MHEKLEELEKLLADRGIEVRDIHALKAIVTICVEARAEGWNDAVEALYSNGQHSFVRAAD